MNLDGVEIKPAEGKIAIRFVDDDDDGDEGSASASPSAPESGVEYEGVLAIVLAVGPKVAGTKKGDVVVMSPWARDSSLCIGGGTHICGAYQIEATLAK